MSNKPRKILAIDAHGVADFRRQLDAQIAEAQRVAGIPVLASAFHDYPAQIATNVSG